MFEKKFNIPGVDKQNRKKEKQSAKTKSNKEKKNPTKSKINSFISITRWQYGKWESVGQFFDQPPLAATHMWPTTASFNSQILCKSGKSATEFDA